MKVLVGLGNFGFLALEFFAGGASLVAEVDFARALAVAATCVAVGLVALLAAAGREKADEAHNEADEKHGAGGTCEHRLGLYRKQEARAHMPARRALRPFYW